MRIGAMGAPRRPLLHDSSRPGREGTVPHARRLLLRISHFKRPLTDAPNAQSAQKVRSAAVANASAIAYYGSATHS